MGKGRRKTRRAPRVLGDTHLRRAHLGLLGAEARRSASLRRAAPGGDLGRESPRSDPFLRPGLLPASVERSPYLPARSGLVVSDKLNITVYYQA